MSQDDLTLQQEEISSLKSIYDQDFIVCPPAKAWKGVAALPEFIIRVKHPDLELSERYQCHLHITFPKSYPTKASPIVRIERPHVGLTEEELNALALEIKSELSKVKGSESVFSVVVACQEWIGRRHPVQNHRTRGESLAIDMTRRARKEEKDRKDADDLLQQAQRKEEEERAARLAEEVREAAEEREAKQKLEREQIRRRKRADSDASDATNTEPGSIENFGSEIHLSEDLVFDSVRLLQPSKDPLGTVFLVQPLTESKDAPLLEMLVVLFDASYYREPQGWKKVRELEAELKKLATLRHVNVQRIYAAKVTPRGSRIVPKLCILRERSPAMTIADLLESCDILSPAKTKEYLLQILEGMAYIHGLGYMHKDIRLCAFGVFKSDMGDKNPIIKICGVTYLARIHALNRSNPFGIEQVSDSPWPDPWLSKEIIDSPLTHSIKRDIYCLGITVIEMVLGRDASANYPDPSSILHLVPGALYSTVGAMIDNKRSMTCRSLSQQLNTESPTTRILPIPSSRQTEESLFSPGSPDKQSTIPARLPSRARQGSRYRDDWEELEFLGSGGFGAVVKAKNRLDTKVYAIKKIRLRPSDNDARIFREVKALARLSHRYIVRYYTTWIELSDGESTPASDSDGGHSDPGLDDTVRTNTNSQSKDIFQLDLDDLDIPTTGSFPSIHFSDSSRAAPEDDDSDDGALGQSPLTAHPWKSTKARLPPSTLYIQMEYVENQTLKEKVADGISEEESWRLFHQIVDALVHMANLGILHRDIKLGNIFIDANGDCKIGDFGLATSSLAMVESISQSTSLKSLSSDVTFEVGTRLYVAPEILQGNHRGGSRNHSKADLYSLGIVFFEMNYKFSTGAERVFVIENLRTPDIIFPESWEPKRQRQKEIIQWLLQHDVDKRPSALELSQSSLLPPRLQDESLKEALQMISKQDSPYQDTLLSLLFDQPPKHARAVLYDSNVGRPEHASLETIVERHVSDIFLLHGSVKMDPPLLLPADQSTCDDPHSVLLLDRHGDLTSLPRNALVPFARLAARTNIRRIKRHSIGNVYQPIAGGGHPSYLKVAVFDIITPSLTGGLEAAVAECLCIMHEIMNKFPGLSTPFEFRLFHYQILDTILARVSEAQRKEMMDVLSQEKSTFPQKRSILLHKRISRAIIDDIECLMGTFSDTESIINRLKKSSPSLLPLITSPLEQIQQAIQHAQTLGVARPIVIQPLAFRRHMFKEGIGFEVTRGNRRSDVLAGGGRHDHLMKQYMPVTHDNEPVRGFGMQIALEKICATLAAYQSNVVKALMKEQKSFGYWTPGRCDVYVISHQAGQLTERLETAALLWRNGISADVMYESALQEGGDHIHEVCLKEGILFTVLPRPRVARMSLMGYKISNVLRRIDTEVSLQELIPWLQQHLAEQRRIDLTTAGTDLGGPGPQLPAAPSKESVLLPDIQMLWPPDKKQLKQNKKILIDKAYMLGSDVKKLFSDGMPMIAIHVTQASFTALTASHSWITDDEAWKTVLDTFPAPLSYAHQIREAVLKGKAEGHRYILLISLRDDQVHLLHVSS
ncbi:Serine/threonine-protein kinase [Sistotremastrum niveocremeum HHB9708]|uniref:non-specific serine/threonine protein kinase n=1 Tax=Sistotremastrum niveocremeum HHB9708 TaxID=1314777 RepID=A0A164XJB6_9AGAM|nr:Serine/threonine-protein kinase [Sistotremastrum niveocremeum HHB9708]